MSPDEILDRAADYIMQHGFAKGAFGLYGESSCALGALGHASWGYDYQEAYETLREHVQDISGESSVMYWNDLPERTEQEVIDAFRTTAKELRNATS